MNWIKNEMNLYCISDLMLATLIPYINLQVKPFLDNKMSIFEEYGAFNYCDHLKSTKKLMVSVRSGVRNL